MTWRSAPARSTRRRRCARSAQAWKAAYVQPSRRPKDGRYGENPNRLQHYYQYQVILKPSPGEPAGALSRFARERSASTWRCTTCASSRTTGRARRSAPGAWAGNAGATAWKCRSSPTSSRSPGFECAPVSGELTYGLERLAMYVQGVDSIYDINFNGRDGADARHLRRRVPAGGGGIFPLQFRARRHGDPVPALQGRRGRVPLAA